MGFKELELPLYWYGVKETGEQWIKEANGEWVCVVDSKNKAEKIIEMVNGFDQLRKENEKLKKEAHKTISKLFKLIPKNDEADEIYLKWYDNFMGNTPDQKGSDDLSATHNI